MINALIAGLIIAYANNTGGGRINITDEQGYCPVAEKMAFAFNESGEVGIGCWSYSQGLIFVNWQTQNGETVKRVYQSNTFTLTPEAEEK